MKGDFTRDTFDVNKHFARVLMQQGRVQLDADWNEQVSVLLHYMQTLAADLIGQYGGPATNTGFKISGHQSFTDDFFIGAGHYYVDGILCELDPEVLSVNSASNDYLNYTVPSLHLDNRQLAANDWIEVAGKTENNEIRWYPAQISAIDVDKSILTVKDAVTENPIQLRRLMTYKKQPDYPDAGIDQNNGPYLAYLDVWERHITYPEMEDMDGGVVSIREAALNGPDTATRAQLVWQVKAKKSDITRDDAKDYEKFLTELGDKVQPGTGRLRAQAIPATTAQDEVCITPPESLYRGSENQLYRVEIHNEGKAGDGATFKWSRDNGSVIFPIRETGDKNVILETLDRDTRLGLQVGDWVEIVDDDYTLQNRAEPLLRVEAIDYDENLVTLSASPSIIVESDLKTHPILRRWDHKKIISSDEFNYPTMSKDGTLTLEEEKWLLLEDGIQIYFEGTSEESPHRYCTGDYWLIPARTATGDVEWPGPVGEPYALGPRGVKHHYAPLWIISVADDGSVTADPNDDLRRNFTQLGA